MYPTEAIKEVVVSRADASGWGAVEAMPLDDCLMFIEQECEEPSPSGVSLTVIGVWASVAAKRAAEMRERMTKAQEAWHHFKSSLGVNQETGERMGDADGAFAALDALLTTEPSA